MTEYVSPIKQINAPQERIFAKLSDLSNLRTVQSALPGGEISLEDCDADSCVIKLNPMGRVALRIVDREPYKTIKFETQQSPIAFALWIQLVEAAPGDTRMKLTVRAELNLFVKKMAGSRIEEGVSKLADMLAMLPY